MEISHKFSPFSCEGSVILRLGYINYFESPSAICWIVTNPIGTPSCSTVFRLGRLVAARGLPAIFQTVFPLRALLVPQPSALAWSIKYFKKCPKFKREFEVSVYWYSRGGDGGNRNKAPKWYASHPPFSGRLSNDVSLCFLAALIFSNGLYATTASEISAENRFLLSAHLRQIYLGREARSACSAMLLRIFAQTSSNGAYVNVLRLPVCKTCFEFL